MATQVTLNSGSVDSAGSLALKTNGTTTAVTIDTSQNVGIGTTSPSARLHVARDGSAVDLIVSSNISTSSVASRILLGNSVGISRLTLGLNGGGGETAYLGPEGSFPMYFQTNGSERMRIDSSGNVGIGTSSPRAGYNLTVGAGGTGAVNGNINLDGSNASDQGAGIRFARNSTATGYIGTASWLIGGTSSDLVFSASSAGTEAMRLDSSGNLLVGRTTDSISVAGGTLRSGGTASFTASSNEILDLNRLSTDGKLQRFFQDSTEEGYITVNGTTVSYVGGHLARCAQTTTNKDESLVKGTVLSNLDEMNVYTNAEGNPVDNEQLNKVKVSDVEGDANVAGVFVNWDFDEAHGVDEINVAMTGDMIIRIAQGTTVARGDLLMSAGDGTAKPQGDDIVRSKTIAKVTSTHVTCTYADGSFCVPCVLMAC
jgi:hypothetical protein